MHTLLQVAALAVTVFSISRLLPGVEVKGVKTAVIVAVVFSLLNFALGWVIHAVLFVPALLTLGLLFFFVPFIVNTVMLWLTDKLIGDFEIKNLRALLISSGAITVVNWILHVLVLQHRLPRF
jgi:putative membrane protein